MIKVLLYSVLTNPSGDKIAIWREECGLISTSMLHVQHHDDMIVMSAADLSHLIVHFTCKRRQRALRRDFSVFATGVFLPLL